MRFYGATRCEAGKAMNEDAFACLGVWAILLDGAGDTKGAAKGVSIFSSRALRHALTSHAAS
jgi:hypothetical protein